MTTPTTPTGKRLGHEPFCVPARECTCRMQYILAIEQEARAMERERLNAFLLSDDWGWTERLDGEMVPSIEIPTLRRLFLADPEPDR